MVTITKPTDIGLFYHHSQMDDNDYHLKIKVNILLGRQLPRSQKGKLVD